MVDEVVHAWQAGDLSWGEAAIPGQMVEDFCVFGTPQRCRQRLERFVQAGIQMPVVSPPPLSQLAATDMQALIDTFGN